MSDKPITEPSSAVEIPLADFRAAYDTLFVLIDHVPPELREASGACGVWSPKQILHHLSGWLVEAEARYHAYDQDENVPGIRYDFDSFNAQSVASREGMGWDESVEELRERMHTMSQHAETAMQNTVQIHRGYAGWLRTLAKDCAEHTEQIRQFISREKA